MPRRFRFPLETLLRVRRMTEEDRKRAFAQAQNELVRQEQVLWSLMVEEARHTKELAVTRRGAIDLIQLRLNEAYSGLLRRRIWAGREELSRRATVLEERRRELAEARKAVRLLERLKERRRENWQLDADREEQKELDEVGQQKFWRTP